MSLAKVYTTKKVRKDWRCEKCGAEIKKGEDGRVSYSVGFRGREVTRCTKTECFPKPSERESSAVASVYAAQEDVDFSSAETYDDIEQMIEDVAAAAEEVADEYESSEMFEINEDLQERADLLREAADTLRDSWADGLDDEPQGDDEDDEARAGFAEAHQAWLEEARSLADSAVNDMELP